MDVPGPRLVPDPLARLEARLRWLTALCAFLTLGFFALLAWQFLPRPRVVEANAFVLRGPDWRRRATLGLRDDGSPILRLNDASEKARILMYVRDNGRAGLRLTDARNVDRARVELEKDGKPIVLLSGPDGHSQVTMAPVGEGYSGIQLLSPDHTPVWKAP